MSVTTIHYRLAPAGRVGLVKVDQLPLGGGSEEQSDRHRLTQHFRLQSCEPTTP